MANKKTDDTITIQLPEMRVLCVPIVGLTPLLMDAWTKSAIDELVYKQMNPSKKKSEKVAIVPEDVAEEKVYRLSDGRVGFPASGVHGAIRRAVKQSNITMVDYNCMATVLPDDGRLMAIEGSTPKLRSDTIRGNVVHRAEITDWGAVVKIRYDAQALKKNDIMSLLVKAGLSVGIGAWRPEKNGTFGTFTIDPDRDVTDEALN